PLAPAAPLQRRSPSRALSPSLSRTAAPAAPSSPLCSPLASLDARLHACAAPPALLRRSASATVFAARRPCPPSLLGAALAPLLDACSRTLCRARLRLLRVRRPDVVSCLCLAARPFAVLRAVRHARLRPETSAHPLCFAEPAADAQRRAPDLQQASSSHAWRSGPCRRRSTPSPP
ncbi:hypothetical protein FA09DRAFT_343446, partial [Tilletiopsis washingtonensis]